MRKRLIAAVLCGILIAGLSGCGNQPKPPAESIPDSTVTADESGIDISDVIPAELTASEESEPPAESSATEPQQPTEKEKPEAEPAPEQTKPSVQTEPQKPAEPTEPQQPQQAPAVQTQPPVPPEPEPAPTEPSKPTEPAPQESEPIPTEPEPIPTESEPTQPAQPEFDVSDWVSYAQSYAQSIGLELDSEAVSCWDNPIIASANSKYLERDLCGMLDKYSRDDDITAVWICAEPRTDTSWDIYIGYA